MIDKLTEEAAKIKETASNFTDEAGRLVLDRFKNPYILTFLISWILFNWRPISYFILSEKKVEEKITFINATYTDPWNYFIFPFGITMLYLFALPYLNTLNEWCIKWSVKFRADYAANHILDKIKRDTKIAIADDMKQKAISTAKESSDKINYITDLEDKNKILQETLASERTTSSDMFKHFEEENRKLSKDLSDTQKLLHDRQINYNDEILAERNKIEELEISLQELDMQKNKLLTDLKERHVSYQYQEWIAERWRNPINGILEIGGRNIIEYFKDGETLMYYDVLDDEILNNKEVFDIALQYGTIRLEKDDEFENGLGMLQRKLIVQGLLKNPSA